MPRYVLDSRSLQSNPSFAIIGCGGTGGFVAEGLCRLLKGVPRARIILIDHDRVEERNLGRQNFHRDELGMFKAEALAIRLSRQFNQAIAYSLKALSPSSRFGGLTPAVIVGCVDNALAREAIARLTSRLFWWLDAGNGDEWGQIFIGNTGNRGYLQGAFSQQEGEGLQAASSDAPEARAARPSTCP